MRFIETTARMLSATGPDGQSLGTDIPALQSMRVWSAIHGGYTWVISHDPGLPTWTNSERAEWHGYTASYRRADRNCSGLTIRVDGGPWRTFAAAEAACRRVWQQIRNPS